MKTSKSNYNFILGLLALIGIVAVVSVVGWVAARPRPIIIQGQAEAAEYRVSGKVPGRIEELYTKEGMMVHKGDTVVHIESPEVRAKLAQAMAARNAAMAQSKKAQNGAAPEQIKGAYEVWQMALAQKDVMQKSFDRVSNLYDKKIITAQKYDETKARYDAAVAQEQAAKSQYDMAVKGAREEDKEAAMALVARADGAIMEVESYLGELFLTSPADGIVSAIFPKVGELVGTGSPIMTVQDMTDVWFTFNIREDLLDGLKVGETVKLMVPALDEKDIEATVAYISVRESYATWKATKETDQYDAKTFEVRVVPTAVIDGIRPGMSAILEK